MSLINQSNETLLQIILSSGPEGLPKLCITNRQFRSFCKTHKKYICHSLLEKYSKVKINSQSSEEIICKLYDFIVDNMLYNHTNAQVFFVAAGAGALDIVKFLHSQDKYIRNVVLNAIANAAVNNQYNVIEYLFNTGVELDEHFLNGVLERAASHGNIKMIDIAIEFGADGDTGLPLSAAALGGHLNAIIHIIDILGVEEGDIVGALYMASKHGRFNVVKYLVETFGLVGNVINNAYSLAWTAQHLDIVKFLTRHGAQFNIPRRRRSNPRENLLAREGTIRENFSVISSRRARSR